MKKEITIAVQVETNRAHGRSMLEGIADYALAHTDWRLHFQRSNPRCSNPRCSKVGQTYFEIIQEIRGARPLIFQCLEYGLCSFWQVEFLHRQ